MNYNLKLIPILLFFFICESTYAQPENKLSKKEINQGWQLLFNGTDFEGWRGVNQNSLPEKGWIIKDESITLNSVLCGLLTVSTFTYSSMILIWKEIVVSLSIE